MSAVDLLGPFGPLARALDDYEHRPEQLAMAEVVERALTREGVALVEAGTGTGKTLAYLVPAILSGKRVVVSTGTKTLEDQIMERDLPLLEEHLGVKVSAAVMKGLGNYLCLRRYEEFLLSPEADRPPLARLLPLLRDFRNTSHSGERSHFSSLPEDSPLWSAVQSGSDTRIGQRCPHYEACFVTRMRRAAEAAQIVVVNHHLFFADLALRGIHGNAGAIPDYDAVIFDEAHQIEDVVTEFFGVRVSSSRLEVMVRDAERAFRATGLLEGVTPILRDVMLAGSGFFAGLPRGPASEAGRRPLDRGAFEGRVKPPMLQLDTALEALELHARGYVSASDAVAQVARRAQRFRNDVALIAEGASSHVTWTETRGHAASLGASPVEVAEILRRELFDKNLSVVLTSATLSTSAASSAGAPSSGKSSGFAFVKERLGIDFEVDELSVASPFDYGQQAALYLPPDLPDPRDPAYVEAAGREIRALIELTGGGAFVLSTSLRMMHELHREVAPSLSSPPLLQGMAPKGELLETFKARGDAVLFASASFWEGVDVPGRALRLVIIDKLPFDVPSDPLVRARCERIEARGEQPFMGYLVPDAALRLKQGFGRLIRTAKDRGIVAVLDRRITQKGYGRVFLKSLPAASRCYSLPEVQAFWDDPPDAPARPSDEG